MVSLPSPELAASQAPLHVAIIMDGNGRWARSRGLPRIEGHRHGADAVQRMLRAADDHGVRYVTIFSFSSENWRRPTAEVDDLMGLLRVYLRSEIGELHRKGVRLRVIGDRASLPADIVGLIEDSEARTADNRALDLIVALNYGARGEIVTAARRLAEDVAAGHINPSDIDEARFSNMLSTAGIPDPDFLIRTSGEQRLSNFLLWQLAYTELVFVDALWPDFGKAHFDAAVQEYGRRERRYGTSVG